MKSQIKGPGIFLAQFAGDEAPFNSLEGITKWAASLGYKGVQIPTFDTRLFDLDRAAEARLIAMKSKAFAPMPVWKSPSYQRIFRANWWRSTRPMISPLTPSLRQRAKKIPQSVRLGPLIK